jgi:hypothetical protein
MDKLFSLTIACFNMLMVSSCSFICSTKDPNKYFVGFKWYFMLGFMPLAIKFAILWHSYTTTLKTWCMQMMSSSIDSTFSPCLEIEVIIFSTTFSKFTILFYNLGVDFGSCPLSLSFACDPTMVSHRPKCLETHPKAFFLAMIPSLVQQNTQAITESIL